MSDTPMSFYGDPLRKKLTALIEQCFALEQETGSLGHMDMRNQLYLARREIANADDVLRRIHERKAEQEQHHG